MRDFEKLGVFYLGKPVDPATQKETDAPLLYESKDLVTHAVCVGMTGNGKTGLCIGLLEEAATDGIPAIAIDPKGDIANLLLTFPELRPSDFRPWVSEDEARVKESAPTSWPLNRPSFGKTDSPLSSRMARDQAAAGRGDGNYLHSGQRSGRAAKY